MAVMLERWNDDKMDALDAKVGRIEVDVARLDGKVGRLETDVEKLDTKLDEHRRETRAGFERIQRTLFLASVTVIAVLIAALIGHP